MGTEMIVEIMFNVATNFIDLFISENGYNWIKKVLFPKKNYVNRLYQIIEETTIEFEKKYPIETDKVPFYQSQPLFEILNQHILFNKLPNKEALLIKFGEYPNVIPPTREQLETFYGMFSLKINSCETLKKLHIKETYKEKIFDISDEIIQIKLLLQSLDEKISFHLNDDWLNKKNQEAIADLGGRYTPKLNVKLEISKIFEGLGRTKHFEEIFHKYIDNFLIKGYKIEICDEISEELSLITQSLKNISTLYSEIDFFNLSQISVNQFCNCISNCQTAISKSESVLWELREESKVAENMTNFYNKYSSIFSKLRKFGYECETLSTFFKSIIVRLSNNPFLLLEGKAGIGKSHLLADVTQSRILTGYPTLFILGQQLTTDESPWVQIFKRLQLINITSTAFLEKLNLYGQKKRKRFLIIIDAINEGNGNRFWNDNINSFIDEIKNFEWLGLIMSVRSTYKDITISPEKVSRNNFEVYEHQGFQNVETEAINLFYDYYKIERPSSPNLNLEFKNPLFLKLLCEGIQKNNLKKVPVGFTGISKIFSFFIDGVNKSLSSPKKYNFDPSFALVNDALNELIKVKLANDNNLIYLKDAQLVVQSVVQEYVSDKTFLSALIDEGLLTKDTVCNEDKSFEEVVFITFQRFDDHLTVNYLLKNVKHIENEFKIDGSLKPYFNDENDFYINQGIVEALSIQLPERFGKELYELLPEFRANDSLINAFIDSLVWRDTSAINFVKIKPFIYDHIFRFNNTFNKFLEMLISISGVEGHPLNANFLHNWLSKYSLPQRDAFWTTTLKRKYYEDSIYRQLIDWAWSDTDKSYISDESIELIATTLCWFLSSSNRKLRDCSTKSLVNLLQARIPILIRIIKKFNGVDDPYIWERVFAVTLGCTLLTKNHEELTQLAKTVFSEVFEPELVYPHILLRDYAREIIEYISYLGFAPKEMDLSKTKPPYKSKWPENIPTRDELKLRYNNEKYGLLWSSIMGEGDFSRYIIGTNFHSSDWSNCKFGEIPINRKQVFEKFKNKLTDKQKKLFESTNPIIYSESAEEMPFGETNIKFNTIIGRKSKDEISTNKILFKRSLSEDLLTSFESDVEPYLNDNNELLDTDQHFDLRIAQRLIFNRVIELGWDPELHGDFDSNIGTGRRQQELFQERIGKKYQWVAYHEYMAMLSDNFIRFEQYGKERQENPYQGPWEPYLRDIDPTILLKNTGIKKLIGSDMWWDHEEVFDWNCTFEEWVSNQATISNPYNLIEVKDCNGTEWLVLESHPSWKEPKIIGHEAWELPRKNIWCQIRGYLVKSEEFEKFKTWADNQHYMGRWMPEGNDRYGLFNREFYWSEAFHFFRSDYHGGSDWKEVTDPKSRSKIADVSATSISYSWEEEFDHSKTDALSFLKPSFLIYDKMGLKNGKVEGSYEDQDNNIVCFAAEALNDSKSYLLIKKEPFLKMLKENDFEIVWTLLGEKNVIGGGLGLREYYDSLEFSGTFYLDNGKVIGTSKIYKDQ